MNATMSLRRLAGVLAALGLVAGMLGSGLGAQFLDSVTGTENIQVGSFGCEISSTSDGAYLGGYVGGHAHTVTYNAPPILSSAPGSAPFSFTVHNFGSIPDVLTVTPPTASAPWSIIGSFAPVGLGSGDSFTYNTGVSWSELNNTNIGQTGAFTWTVSCADGSVIFSNTPALVPSNLASYGPQAYSYTEWGGGVTFAGTARDLSTATVTLSSWACETGDWNLGTCVTTPGATFSVPITFTLYNVNAGNVGTVITAKTDTFVIPYRPTSTPALCGGDITAWYDGTACFHGLAHNITFNFPSGTMLPNTAIFGITFNTTSSGYSPLGAGTHPTDSLNIATYPANDIATEAIVGLWLPSDVQTYLAPRFAATMIGTGPVAQMPTGPSDNFVSYMPAVMITAN
ncbi:MAG: hypothetical protein ABI573_11095 [Chloroflexota bacterium]